MHQLLTSNKIIEPEVNYDRLMYVFTLYNETQQYILHLKGKTISFTFKI